jgi:hypothetical protein
MAQARPGTSRHKLTNEERAKGARAGGLARAAKIQEEREQAQTLADEKLAALTEKALSRLDDLLDSDLDFARARGIREVLDRVLGKPTVRVEHSGKDGGPMRIDLSRLSDAELTALRSILEKGNPGTKR